VSKEVQAAWHVATLPVRCTYARMTSITEAYTKLHACGLSPSFIGTAVRLLSKGDEFLPLVLSTEHGEELRTYVEAYLGFPKPEHGAAGTCAALNSLGTATRRRAMPVSHLCDIPNKSRTHLRSVAPAEMGNPLTAAGIKRVFEEEDFQKVMDQAMKRAMMDREDTVSISKFNAQHWEQMSKAAGVTYEAIELSVPDVQVVPPFEWTQELEPNQADR
jgi:hypothetical protein